MQEQEIKVDYATHRDRIFSKVFNAVHNCNSRYIVVYGSAASGKSYSVHQSELIRLMEEEKGDTLFLRKYAVDHRESCYKLLCSLIESVGMSDEFKCVYSGANRRITYKSTGRSIVFRGLDNTEKIKSIVGFKRVVIEEANQLTFTDFKEVLRRARGFEGIQFILILNPVSENHWIKKYLCDETGVYYPKTSVFKFNYHDNCDAQGRMFITQDDVEELENLKLIDENQYRIYALGEWGVEDRNRKFVWAFEREKHIKPTVHNPNDLTWASFDFNVNPLTCTIFQVYEHTKTLRAIECIKLPNSDIWKMCDIIKASYPNCYWHITGDATGASRQAISRDNLNYYHVIKERLGIMNSLNFKIPNVNPPITENQMVVNAAFKLWTVEIDPIRCEPLIYDITYVETDANKKIVKDRSAENKCADFLDTLRYLINVAVKPYLPKTF